MCDTPIARITGCVFSLRIQVGDSHCNYSVAIRVNRVMLGRLCADNYKTRFCGGQYLTAVEGNASVYQVNPVSRITGEERAEFLRTWGPGFDQKGGREGGRGGRGRVGQLNLCVETINP